MQSGQACVLECLTSCLLVQPAVATPLHGTHQDILLYRHGQYVNMTTNGTLKLNIYRQYSLIQHFYSSHLTMLVTSHTLHPLVRPTKSMTKLQFHVHVRPEALQFT